MTRRHPWMATRNALDELRHDLSYSLRRLARSPAYVAVSVASLAFGVAGATVFFSLINAALFRPAPLVQEPEDLVALYTVDSLATYGPLSYPDMVDVRRQTDALEDVAAMGGVELAVGESGQERQVRGEQVSENYFELLGITLAHGRGFTTADVEAEGNVVILGHRFWERELERDPEVLGKTLRIDGRVSTVIGVAPAGMLELRTPAAPDLWVPIRPAWRANRAVRGLAVVGRLHPGATREQAQAQLDLVAARLAAEYPDEWTDFRGEMERLTLLPEREARVPPHRRRQVIGAAVMLLIVILLVLLVSCSNVGNLTLARAVGRREEIAVRLALGIGRRRLVGQLLTESALIAGTAVALGFLLTHWVTDLVAKGHGPMPLAIDIGVDVRVAAFCVVLAAATALLFGLAPALQASKPNLVEALKGQGDAGRSRWFSLKNLLIAAQVAGSLVLAVAATLLLRSFREIREADLGFEPKNVAVMPVNLSHRGYSDPAARQFYDDLAERLSALPEVESVSLARTVLLGPIRMFEHTKPEGHELAAPELPLVGVNTVGPGFFGLSRIPLVSGRDFRAGDDEAAPRVVIVSQAFARRFWPGENPIGKRVTLDEPAEVIGVVGDASYGEVTEEPPPYLWMPFGQRFSADMTVHVRTKADPRPWLATFRDEVRALDRELPTVAPTLLEDVAAEATLVQRNLSALLGAVGALTLGLAMMGIYGMMVFAVGRHRREIGIRIALGADPEAVTGMVLKEGLRLSGVGLAAGFAMVLVVARLMSSVLYGVHPLDPVSLTGGVTLLLVATVVATLPAAWRAAQVDPMETLRAE